MYRKGVASRARLERVIHRLADLTNGVDYIYRPKMDLPPRPQLPTSPVERQIQAAAVADAIRSPNP